MVNIIFPTDTTAVTTATDDLLLVSDTSDSGRPKEATIEDVVLTIKDDASTATNRIWSASKVNTVFATKTDGAASSTDNAVARFDSTTGKIIQNSVVIIDDTGVITGVDSITIGGATGNTLVVDTSTLVVDATNNRVGLLTTAPTHTLTQGSTGTGYAHYNTADQTTNFEVFQTTWNSNILFIGTGKGGSGTQRGICLSSSSGAANGTSGNNTRLTVTQGTGVNFNFNSSSTGNITEYIKTPSTFTASSVVTSILSLSPTINMTATGGFCLLDLNPTLTATGSGAKNAILYRNSSGGTLFGVDSSGGLLNARVISANAATPVNITAFDSNKVYTNEGATAKIVYNLPTAVAGYQYTFIVQDTDGIDVTAAAGDTIRRNTSVTAAAGTVTSTTIGSTLTLVAINATERVAVDQIGTWA